MHKRLRILALETSCDDTGAAVMEGRAVLSNAVSGQSVHGRFGGVVPELASRAHIQLIVPVVESALEQAKISPSDLDAVAYTRGPGLLGSLLVGASFGQSMAQALGIPALGIHHLKAHVLAHHIEGVHPEPPDFPYLALTVSGGHTQLLKVHDPERFEILGQTIDDAAGEAFDKAAKMIGLPYPGGPLIDVLSEGGDPLAFSFAKPRLEGLNMSFSGLKTSILYTLRPLLAQDPDFLVQKRADLAASIQHSIVAVLVERSVAALRQTGLRTLVLSGGVAANRALRAALSQAIEREGGRLLVPPLAYCTDNAAMIGIAAVVQGAHGALANPLSSLPIRARIPIDEEFQRQ